MGVIVPGPALVAEPQKREVVRVGLEAVLDTQAFIERLELRFGYLDGVEAELTHQVFVIVVQRDVPPPGLPVSQGNVVDKPDTGQIIQHPVHSGGFDPTGALQYVINDHPGADEGLVTLHQGADHCSSGKGQPQSGLPDSFNQKVFGDNDVAWHAFE